MEGHDPGRRGQIGELENSDRSTVSGPVGSVSVDDSRDWGVLQAAWLHPPIPC